MNRLEVEEYVEHFHRRVLQDALNQATRTYWLRRAEQFEDAKPRLDDYHGNATRAELSRQWNLAHETAEACRRRAEAALFQDQDTELIAEIMAEVMVA